MEGGGGEECGGEWSEGARRERRAEEKIEESIGMVGVRKREME